MSIIWNPTKNISKKLTSSSNAFSTLSSNNEYVFNTISTEEKGRLTTQTKSVSFGPVEIVKVESYKKYNQLEEISYETTESGCMKCCGTFCQCNIF